MMDTIGDVCLDAKSTKCSEGGCRVALEKSFVTYCGEVVRDQMMKKGKTTLKMFDCIITDSDEGRISAVELKYRKGYTGVLKGKRKAGNIDDIREKFTNGLVILRRILERISKSCICIQLVLYTKTEIQDRSELIELHRPLDNVSPKLSIATAVCGAELPKGYVTVSVQDLSA